MSDMHGHATDRIAMRTTQRTTFGHVRETASRKFDAVEAGVLSQEIGRV